MLIILQYQPPSPFYRTNKMLSEKLFKKVLIDPVNAGADELYIVSGYATSAMAFHHLNSLKSELRKDVKVNLIVGMCVLDGLSESNHRGFKKIMEDDFKGRFTCSYITNTPPLHSKVYAWCKGKTPVAGFVGSPNYTQTAFYEKQRECIVETNPAQCLKYFKSLTQDTIYCNHIDAESSIQIYPDSAFARFKRPSKAKEILATETPELKISGVPYVKIPLLAKDGTLPERSGLNWGQRPEEHRDPDQAYIRLPAEIYKTDFFPPVSLHFTVQTDDNKILTCTRAQQNGKAIHTPHDNSLLGQYFRNRLGLAEGELVKKSHLLKYGRTDIDFYRIEDETYYMDFSKPS